MKLRVISVTFNQNAGRPVRIQVGNGVRTMAPNSTLEILELGNSESYGRAHLCGVLSQDISDTSKVQRHVDLLENLDTESRLKWFADNFPGAKTVKIDSELFNKDTRAAVIAGSFELRWSN